nr:unnamed protein product [Callosobruchus analis]
MNRVYHPNIDEVSGTVCLDVINQAWTALYGKQNSFNLHLFKNILSFNVIFVNNLKVFTRKRLYW